MRAWPGLLLLLACTTARTPTPRRPAVPAAGAMAAAVSPRPAPAQPAETSPSDDELCQADGFDFAYGSEEHNGKRELTCGVGPGTACTDDSCEGTKLLTCHQGRRGMVDCRGILSGGR